MPLLLSTQHSALSTSPPQAMLLTPRSPAAIAVIVLQDAPTPCEPPLKPAVCDGAGQSPPASPTARSILRTLCLNPAIASLRPGQTALAQILSHGQTLDQALILNLPTQHSAPSTQHSVDRFELHLHGGLAVVDATLRALSELGVQIIDPASSQALPLAHGLSAPDEYQTLLGQEILATLPQTQSLSAVQLLTHQLTPTGLQGWTHHWSHQLTNTNTPTWQFHSAIQWLLDRSRSLAHFLAPPRIALIGPPNAGKSTLANALLGRPVSITSPTPGTTRDWVDAPALFLSDDPSPRQLPVTLIDTAGLRLTDDPIESESIRRTHHQIRHADLILLILDATTAFDPTLLNNLPPTTPHLIVINKSDLSPESPHPSSAPALFSHFASCISHSLPISALHQTGLDALMTAALARLNLAPGCLEEPFAFTPRQQTLLNGLATTDDRTQILSALATLIG